MGTGIRINFGTVLGSLLAAAVLAATGAGITAYAADGKAEEAKQTAELAEAVNHTQNLRIQFVEQEQGHIKDTVDSNAKKLDAISRAMGIPIPIGG